MDAPQQHWSRSPTPSHSNEVEHRLTLTEATVASHEKRISASEQAIRGLIAAVTALGTAKSGDLAEVLLKLLSKP